MPGINCNVANKKCLFSVYYNNNKIYFTFYANEAFLIDHRCIHYTVEVQISFLPLTKLEQRAQCLMNMPNILRMCHYNINCGDVQSKYVSNNEGRSTERAP